ncbi:MAG: LytTR family transcriptional regulator DNA-binding domain-containing protein [Saprospiraceae bacterium]|nr:LytTR family transcriptional regulator DNA-binding domain-containing protein [Saprospiraceae bacterium]
MTEQFTKVLVVEDEMLIGAKISMYLTDMGYEVAGILPRGEEAVAYCRQSPPDLLLLDINLKGELDGVETAVEILKERRIPIIYITANADDLNFNRAKSTRPEAFISKPFKKLDLQRAIELVVSKYKEVAEEDSVDDSFILSDRIFVRHRDGMVKIILADILYIEADRSYCKIHTADSEYLLSMPLKALYEKLESKVLIRVHRSYLINLLQVEKVSESHAIIGQAAIPIGKNYRDELSKRLRLI